MLTSSHNPRIKEALNLRESDYRKESGLFLIEGRREFRLALTSRVEIKDVFLCPELLEITDLLAELKKKEINICEVSSEVYSKIAFGNRKEGIVAIAREPRLSLADLKLKNNPLLVVLERIEKPGNLGAIVRTADASGVDAVIASDSIIDIYNPNAVRSSLGAIFTTKVIREEAKEIIPWLRSNSIKIICALPQADLVYTAVNFKESCAIVLGSEDKGLGDLWKGNADYHVRIPMLGESDSLNVSTAAGVLLYEALRQRESGLGYFGKSNHDPLAS
ncbi:MAG: RNA methyltransferase [Candidatus Omnitrophota bacterium]